MDDVILAVDEAEDLLRVRGEDTTSNGITKVYLNRLLENGYTTIWIVNDIDEIPGAVRRRCKYAIPFGILTSRDRLKAWNVLCEANGLELSERDIADLAARYVVPVGAIVTAIENAVDTTGDKAGVERSIRSMGNFVFDGLPNILSGERPPAPYYPQLENFTEVRRGMDPKAFRAFVTQHVNNPVRILSYGPDGAGKKSFFRDIAQKTDRELLTFNIGNLLQGDGTFFAHVLQETSNKPCIIVWEGMEAFNNVPANHTAIPKLRAQMTLLMDTIPCMQVFLSGTKDEPPHWLKQDFSVVLEHKHLMLAQIKEAWKLFFGEAEPNASQKYNALTPGHFMTIVNRNRGFGQVAAAQITGDLQDVSGAAPEQQAATGARTFRPH
jgi:hypothetical protein